MTNFWDYRSRKAEKDSVRLKVRPPLPAPKDLEPTQEIEVQEDSLSDTGIIRFFQRIAGRK